MIHSQKKNPDWFLKFHIIFKLKIFSNLLEGIIQKLIVNGRQVVSYFFLTPHWLKLVLKEYFYY